LTAFAKWAVEEFAGGFASAIEGMAMARPGVTAEVLTAAPQEQAFRWKQQFAGLTGDAFVTVSEPDMLAVGQHVMLAAGVEDSAPEDLKSTFLECLGQAFSVLARAMTARLGREVTLGAGKEAPTATDVVRGGVRLTLGEQTVNVVLGLSAPLLEAFVVPEAKAAVASASPSSKTFDLLLDVELPVSVSFGHAQVPLKDVLKLTTGSIVELSRAVVEPVDIVVNNCVIAKGEVVVIEGNFGVRIQQVISRSERLRSLQ
jgi:flagellar motor switch protein FliN/FliY